MEAGRWVTEDLLLHLLQVVAGLKDTRDRINSVKNTQKITDAMKLVAAAKVRRAQDAVVNGRPFAENLVKVGLRPSLLRPVPRIWYFQVDRRGVPLAVMSGGQGNKGMQVQVLYGVNQRLRIEDVDSPLVNVRPVKSVTLVVVTGDRGLCGGYNNFVLKKVRRAPAAGLQLARSWAACISNRSENAIAEDVVPKQGGSLRRCGGMCSGASPLVVSPWRNTSSHCGFSELHGSAELWCWRGTRSDTDY